jgi:hypothetical protein
MNNYVVAYLAILCDCDYDEESNVIGNMCKYCKEKDDIERKKKWYEEIKTIKKLLLHNEYIVDDRIPNVRKLLEYILTCDNFIAQNPRFRNILESKIIEFKCDQLGTSLIDIYDKMDIFLEELKNHPEYKN